MSSVNGQLGLKLRQKMSATTRRFDLFRTKTDSMSGRTGHRRQTSPSRVENGRVLLTSVSRLPYTELP
ncbi:MAG: hypothetical protein DWI21_17245 [Planctomycetota bacterium]|nr:MAG: hypothetical protein DWI21_17245 [Planctomycetota bacterium]